MRPSLRWKKDPKRLMHSISAAREIGLHKSRSEKLRRTNSFCVVLALLDIM